MELTEEEIELMDKLIEFVYAKQPYIMSDDYIMKELNMEFDQYWFINNKAMEIGEDLKILKAQKFNSGSYVLHSFNNYEFKKFSKSGGFKAYFLRSNNMIGRAIINNYISIVGDVENSNISQGNNLENEK